MITDEQVDEMIEKLRVAFGAGTKGQLIAMMANRFLSWKLPEHFYPDNGISFARTYNTYIDGKFVKDAPRRMQDWPIGTNLFTYEQAQEMIRHMLTPDKR